MIRIGWFSTGRGEGSRGLLRLVQDQIAQGELDAEISFVFSNREPGEQEGSDEFFRLVRGYGLPVKTLSSKEFRRARGGRFAAHREEYDSQVLDLLGGYEPDVCVLAGYMLILGKELCRKYPFLNLHPALPDGPIGTWQSVIWELIEKRATKTGAMIHRATEEVDRGPVVSYCTVSIDGEDFRQHWDSLGEDGAARVKEEVGEDFPLFQLIRREEYRREPFLLLETLRAVAAGKVRVGGGRLLDDLGKDLGVTTPEGLCLDGEVERALRENEAS